MFEIVLNMVFLISAIVLGLWQMAAGGQHVDHVLWLNIFGVLCLPVPIANLVMLTSAKCYRSRIRRISVMLNWAFLTIVAIHYLTDAVSTMSFYLLWSTFTAFGVGAAVTAALASRVQA